MILFISCSAYKWQYGKLTHTTSILYIDTNQIKHEIYNTKIINDIQSILQNYQSTYMCCGKIIYPKYKLYFIQNDNDTLLFLGNDSCLSVGRSARLLYEKNIYNEIDSIILQT